MRPCTPTRMTIWPLTTAQSRAARTNMPWYFSDIASLLPSGGGGGKVSVEAPWRMSRKGHWTSGCALVTGCGSFWVAPEKKFAILSFRDGVLGTAGAGGWAAPVDAGAGGWSAPFIVGAGGWAAPVVVGAGGAALVEAVATGAPVPPPLQPASNSNANATAAGDPGRQPDPGNACFVPRVIAKFAIPDCYSKLMTAFPRHFAAWLKRPTVTLCRNRNRRSRARRGDDPARCRRCTGIRGRSPPART